MQLLSCENAGKADPEFVMNVDDVRTKILHQFQPSPAKGGSHAISIETFALDGRAMENSILDIMLAGLVIRSDNQNLVSLLQKPVSQDFYMGYDSVDMGQIRFGK